MKVAAGCPLLRTDLALYVLGAIAPADRAVVEHHLSGCAGCREELAGMAGLPALLAKVPTAEAARICREPEPGQGGTGSASGELVNRMLARAAQARRHRRWRLTAAAAALIIAAAGPWVLPALTAAPQPGPAASQHWAAPVSGTGPVAGARAAVRYAAQPWGTQLAVHVSGIPGRTICQLRVTLAGGQTVEAGSWAIAAHRPGTWYPAAIAAPPASIRSFAVTRARKILVLLAAHRPAALPPPRPPAAPIPRHGATPDKPAGAARGAGEPPREAG